jgi:hypothetical protein
MPAAGVVTLLLVLVTAGNGPLLVSRLPRRGG